MENRTLIYWGVGIIVLGAIVIFMKYYRKLRADAFNFTREDLYEYFKR